MEIEIWLISWKAEQSCQNANNTCTYQYTSGEGECCKHEKIMKNGPVFSNQIVQLISNYQPIKSEHHMNKTNHTSVNKQQSEHHSYVEIQYLTSSSCQMAGAFESTTSANVARER